MTRPTALAAAIAVALLAVSGAGGAAAQTPKRGGTLVFRMVPGEPVCLNVLDARCGWVLPEIVGKVLLKPFEIGPDFTFEESLVSRVDFTRRRPFTLTYHIRPEARWSDGVPVTAQDFIFTLRAIRRSGAQWMRELHAPVRSARAVDRKTVRVVLRPRSARWHDFFGSILPSHALRGSDLTQVWGDRIDDPRTGRPIGSGPFLVERLERGRQLVLRRNSRYWGPRPAYVERLVIPFAQSASDLGDAAGSGDFDVAWRSTTGCPGRSSAAWGALGRARKHRIRAALPPARSRTLIRRSATSSFGALSHTASTALRSSGRYSAIPSARALDSVVHLPPSRYYQPNWSAYRYRPAQARRLLGQAGCRRGADGIFSCGGQRLSLRFVTTATPFRAQEITLMQAQLRTAGVEVVPVFAPPATFFGQILPQGAFDVALFTWVYTPGDPPGEIYGCGAPQNYTGYCQRLVTAELDQADRILDDRARARVLNRADRWLASDVPTIPLYQFVFTAAYDTSVRNFVFLPWNPLWNAENWWLAE